MLLELVHVPMYMHHCSTLPPYVCACLSMSTHVYFLKLSSPVALLLAARRGSGLGVRRLARGSLHLGLERGEAAGRRGGQRVFRPRVPRVAPRLHARVSV